MGLFFTRGKICKALMASVHYSHQHTSVIAFIRIREPLQKFAIRVIFDKEKLSQAIDPLKFACQKHG